MAVVVKRDRDGRALEVRTVSTKDADRLRKYVPPNKRSDVAIGLLASGIRHGEVREFLIAEFDVAPITAEKDIEQAYEILVWEDEKAQEHRKTLMRTYLWSQARKAETLGDTKGTLAACKLLMRIDGLEAPSKHEHTGELLAGVLVVPGISRSD